ncbi:MAG: hypothetical protein KDK89_08895 [Alphaproteobacteria bacterium]|nr:hypothetical protein [Alphaproteobacteria bacterium]
MALPLALIAQTAAGLFQGPLNKVLDAYVSDIELRRKLAAELEQQFMTQISRSMELGTSVVLAETQSEHWLTRSWRPMLMLILMGFLIVVGLLLPLVDMIAGHPVRFEPRWTLLPTGFWDFLSVGMGGYIGGRSLEKVAGLILPSGPHKAVAAKVFSQK